MSVRTSLSSLALLLALGACAPAPYQSLPTVAELNSLPLGADIYKKYPELEGCGPMSSGAFANTVSTRSADSLVQAWGEPNETSISAWNLMIWMIPLAPVTVWEWTGFDRTVEMTIWHPLSRGYRAAVWQCDFGPLKPR